ncbi:hypothetical protein BDK51DRAFT_27912 [Blyttiomyces helicus]|uniref:Uncharacterized protein n=1 Tax=Blyttiomyces helicus TaxID=388810 RepID=A0A4P9WSD3_9FUNG|nr:hypothetical protein BDK51DRAFT_27912 [Blyttiomyces helicus]|eukprot:RKO93906.1 hypothetical protein BDK51DRAFT_27912 [Blyttiomyces helicus]
METKSQPRWSSCLLLGQEYSVPTAASFRRSILSDNALARHQLVVATARLCRVTGGWFPDAEVYSHFQLIPAQPRRLEPLQNALLQGLGWSSPFSPECDKGCQSKVQPPAHSSGRAREGRSGAESYGSGLKASPDNGALTAVSTARLSCSRSWYQGGHYAGNLHRGGLSINTSAYRWLSAEGVRVDWGSFSPYAEFYDFHTVFPEILQADWSVHPWATVALLVCRFLEEEPRRCFLFFFFTRDMQSHE